jgi:hypothetical protein
VTAAVAISGWSFPEVVASGALNAATALVAAVVVRALDLRFGEPERLAW